MDAMEPPSQIELDWKAQYRIIPSTFPPINFFEDLVNPDDMDAAFYVESLTNDRLRQEAGDISLVSAKDRIAGTGSSVIMAAFTHVGRASRFTNGSYGVYYAAQHLETAIRETVYHRERFMRATQEAPMELAMRVYKGRILKPMHDIRSEKYNVLHDANNYINSQQFGAQLKTENAWGIVYNSVRHANHHCIAAFRPPAISIPSPTKHLKYLWNGERVTEVKQEEIILIL